MPPLINSRVGLSFTLGEKFPCNHSRQIYILIFNIPTCTIFEYSQYFLSFQNCYGKTLNGTFRIRGSDDAVFEGHVDQHQKPNGFCRVINANGDVEFFGCFLHGRLIGNCWKSLLGGMQYDTAKWAKQQKPARNEIQKIRVTGFMPSTV